MSKISILTKRVIKLENEFLNGVNNLQFAKLLKVISENDLKKWFELEPGDQKNNFVEDCFNSYKTQIAETELTPEEKIVLNREFNPDGKPIELIYLTEGGKLLIDDIYSSMEYNVKNMKDDELDSRINEIEERLNKS
jgi:hypothetical protein